MKLAFWSVFALGFLACSTLGIGPTLQRAGGSWLSVPMVLGSLLGVTLLAIAVAFAFPGLRPALISADKTMVYALAALIVAKVGVSLVHTAVVTAAKG